MNPGGAEWYAVWTRNQCEQKVEDQLGRKSFQVFLPRVRVPSRRRDRHRILVQPLFPGYLFLRFAPSRESYIRVASTDGVVRVLGDGWDRLSPVGEEQVDAVRRVVSVGGAGPVPWVTTGEPVRIVAGPLAGLTGRVGAWRRRHATFVVNVDLLQRSVGVEVDAGLLAHL